MPKLYVKTWCPWCVEAEAWLKDREIAYTQVDVLADSGGFSRMKQISGQTRTPTIEMEDGDVLADFDVGQLEAFLRNRGEL